MGKLNMGSFNISISVINVHCNTDTRKREELVKNEMAANHIRKS